MTCARSTPTTSPARSSPELGEVAAQQRDEDDPPAAPAGVADDARVAQPAQRAAGVLRRDALVQARAGGHALRQPLRVAADRPDALQRLLLLEPVGAHRRTERRRDDRAVEAPAQLGARDEMRLLGEQHRSPRVALAELDEPLERRVLDRAAVERQPRADAGPPLDGGDRRQLVEGAELAQRALAGR